MACYSCKSDFADVISHNLIVVHYCILYILSDSLDKLLRLSGCTQSIQDTRV